MKISVIENIRRGVEAVVNQFYMVNAHDIAHDRKRTLAQAVSAGGEPTAEFAAAAAIEGVTPEALAQTILGKPDEMMTKENERRAMIIKVRNAETVDDLKAIETSISVSKSRPPARIV